jgi:hypothetical protein
MTSTTKIEKVSPFKWVDCLTQKIGDLMEEHGEAAYPAFMVNRAMSQYQDCILYAAEINLYKDLDNRYAYDFYMNALRKKKRFAKWGKKKTGEGDILAVMEHYGYSRTKAEEAMRVLSPEQLAYIMEYENAKVQS